MQINSLLKHIDNDEASSWLCAAKGSLGLDVARIKHGLCSIKYPLGTDLKDRSGTATGLKTLWISANCPFRIFRTWKSLKIQELHDCVMISS